MFKKRSIQNAFRFAPIKEKHLREYFSSEWERRNGNHQIKERLLGHSLKSIDKKHYSYLDTEDIKNVYDKIME